MAPILKRNKVKSIISIRMKKTKKLLNKKFIYTGGGKKRRES